MSETMHLMTIEMGAWCGASGPGDGRASSQWRDVTCPACLSKGTQWLRALVWDMLQTMPPSGEALGFAVRAGRLGVTDEQGRPLAMACATGEADGSDSPDGGDRDAAGDARDLRALAAVMLSWTEDRLRFDLTPADEAKLAEFRAGLGGSPDGGREKS